MPIEAPLNLEIDRMSIGCIGNLDLKHVSPDQFQAIVAAWHRHGVISAHDQDLSKEQLVAFSRMFGIPERADNQEKALIVDTGPPEIMIVSNVVENGRPIGHLGNKEAYWHTDMCYTDSPPIASILYAREVPDEGGDTSFMDMNAVYESLPARLKELAATLSIKHDRSYTAVGDLRHGYDPVTSVRESPGAVHPVVKTHPATGCKSLYLGRRRCAYVMGMPVDDSEALLDELWTYTEAPELVCRHRWSVGDLLIWDNRRLMHKREAFDAGTRRLMWRSQIQADPSNRY
ncbi:MAG: TauD/TfdA family dioxygenase [Sphingomonadales bacterium]|nr:TauD/TfdA family dioxygenase [Sphingomonadales bacterium]